MMNLKNVSAKFSACLHYSWLHLFSRRTDFLSMNMIKKKRLTPPHTRECFQEPEKDFCEWKDTYSEKDAWKDGIEARKFMLRSPNHAAISTMISTIVLLRVRSYSESTKVRVALWIRFFCSVLTHSCTFPEVHIEKGNVIVQSIVSLRQLLYVILTMSLNHTTPLSQESSLCRHPLHKQTMVFDFQWCQPRSQVLWVLQSPCTYPPPPPAMVPSSKHCRGCRKDLGSGSSSRIS